MGDSATANVRCSNRSKLSVETPLDSTVEAFKSLVATRSEVPAAQQKLIYKGRILKDNQTLDSYDTEIFPDREDELKRIGDRGGKVINLQGPRVLGVLAMSRSIGDRYMRPWIISVPELSFTSRNEDDDCLILASDGLWNVMSNGEVCSVATHLLRRYRRNGVVGEVLQSPAQAIVDHLTMLAYRKNSSDNISVIVVDLKSGSVSQPSR